MNFAGKMLFTATAAVACAALAHAGLVANPSFESPSVPLAQLASPFPDSWATDGPVKTDVGGGFMVNLNTGIFPNTDASSPDHIDNLDGSQAAYIGAQTGNEFTQVLGSNFTAGTQYTLTVAVGRSYGQPPDSTASLRIALYYTGTDLQRHLVTSQDIFNDTATALSATHLADFSTTSSFLAPDDAAINQPIGVLLTTTGPAGGFFDMDNVRLTTVVPEPTSLCFVLIGASALLRRRNEQL